MAEGRMNLAALQQRDPYISDILDTASQVALYSFNAKANEWEKTSIEGSLFVYKRSASPVHGFMILNRLGLNNLIEPITKDLEFQQQDPFLLYRNAKSIYGIWFYEKDKCSRLGQLMNSYLQETVESQQKKLSSPRTQRSVSVGGEGMHSKGKLGGMPQSQVDIMQMLSKAQQEYNTTKAMGTGEERKKTEPKPMIDNPNAAATKNTNLIRPMPLKMPESDSTTSGQEAEGTKSGTGLSTTPATAPISLDALFRTASLQQQGGSAAPNFPPASEVSTGSKSSVLHRSVSMSAAQSEHKPEAVFKHAEPKRSSEGDNMPTLLKHIMSTGSMVEDIERLQIESNNAPPTVPPHAPPTVPPPTHQRRPPSSSRPPPIQGQGFTLGPGPEESVFQVPDVSVPPPIHPAYRGPSPHDPVSVSKSSPRGYGTSPIVSGNLTSQKTSQEGSFTPDTGRSEKLTQRGPTPRGDADNIVEGSVPSPVGIKPGTGPVLLTPAELVIQQTVSVAPSEKPTNPSLAAAATSLSADVLLSPMAFVTSFRKTPPVSTAMVPVVAEKSEEKEEDSLPIAALTKQQMQQALLYLLKNDPSFISTLHEAYLKSLQELSGQKS